MFIHKSIKELLFEIMQENEALKAQNIKIDANVNYIAMMSDIDLEEGENDEQEI